MATGDVEAATRGAGGDEGGAAPPQPDAADATHAIESTETTRIERVRRFILKKQKVPKREIACRKRSTIPRGTCG